MRLAVIAQAHHVIAATDGWIFMNFRTVSGQILGHSLLPTQPSLVEVPSLGLAFDRFADAFGYTTDFILHVHRAACISQSRGDFIARLNTVRISSEEAEWIYDIIPHNASLLEYGQRFRSVSVPF